MPTTAASTDAGDEGEQLDREGTQAQHPDPQLVLPGGGRDVARTGALEPGHQREDDHEQQQRDPVQVAGVGDADERVGHVRGVQPQALLTAGHVRVAADQHRAGLREGEGDHGEGDAADPQPDRAEHQRDDRSCEQREQHRRHQPQLGALEHDAQPVGADGQVERVAEAQQPGHPEDHVVGQRQRGEDQRERHQLQRPRRVRRSRQHAGHAQVHQRQHRQQRDETQHDEQPQARSGRACATPGAGGPARRRGPRRTGVGGGVGVGVGGGAHARAPIRPEGRTRSTAASSSTTTRSPVPAR